MRKLLLFLFVALPVFAQNSRYDSVALGPRGPIPFAAVAVCTQPANTTTSPCSPLANLCSSLTDAICTSPNPVTADSLGNYHFYGKPTQGPFTIQLYGPQVAAPGAIPDQTLGGSGSSVAVKSLNGIQFADQSTGSDLGAKINAALAAGNPVFIPCGTYNAVTTTVSITNISQSIIGAGSGCVIINYTGTGDFLRIQMSPFTVNQAGHFGGFSIVGTASGVSGIHIGDTIGAQLDDIHVSGFTGVGGAGIWFANTTNWTERTLLIRVWSDGNTIGFRFTNSGAQNSVEFTKMVDARLNVNSSQTGFSFENNVVAAGTYLNATVNIAGTGGTVLSAINTATVNDTVFDLFADTSNLTSGTLVNVAAGATVQGTGLIVPGNPSTLTNSITGLYQMDLTSMFGASYLLRPGGLGSALNPYTLIVNNPATTRNLNISDPGGNDTFTFNAAPQTLSNKSTAAGPLTGTVASGTATMTTALIGANTCGTTVTVAATGVLTTDTIIWSYNAAPANPPADLVVAQWPTAGNVNFEYCNPTAAGATPGAATINWRVIR